MRLDFGEEPPNIELCKVSPPPELLPNTVYKKEIAIAGQE